MSSQDDDVQKQRLQWLFQNVLTIPSIQGFLIVAESGGVYLANLPADLDTELVSLQLLALVHRTRTASYALANQQLKGMYFHTESSCICAFKLIDKWVFVFAESQTRDKLLTLLERAELSKGDLNAWELTEDLRKRASTLEASEDLQTLLLEIGTIKGVIGCLVVGHDGLLIANSMPEETDAEAIGVWSLGIYMNTEYTMKKMGHERVHQIVNRTPRGYVVVADFGGGLLVSVTEFKGVENLIPLMRKITDLMS